MLQSHDGKVEACEFSEGMACIKMGRKYGYIDKKGHGTIVMADLDLKQANPVEFSMGDAADFFGAVNSCQPPAAA